MNELPRGRGSHGVLVSGRRASVAHKGPSAGGATEAMQGRKLYVTKVYNCTIFSDRHHDM